MKKILVIFAILFTGFLSAQTGTTFSAKIKMNSPVAGTVHDSCVVWNGTDKQLKFIPFSDLLAGFGGSQDLQSVATNGNTFTDGTSTLTLFPSEIDLAGGTNSLVIGVDAISLNDGTAGVTIQAGSVGLAKGTNSTLIDTDEGIRLVQNSGSKKSYIRNTNGTTDGQIYELPNKAAGSYTLATTEDITGSGTVSTVSVVTANGVTGSVANATTTPAITLSLGAITPTTVVASGNVTAPNIDSTNKTDIATNASNIALKANIASPTFTGTVTVPNGSILGTPTSVNLANATFPTLNQNTSGTAANLSGTPALPNGTTATTQTANDNSTKIATTAYVDGINSKKVRFSSSTPTSALTGTTTETQMLKLTMPVGTFSLTDFIDIEHLRIVKTTATSTVTWRIKISTSSTMPTGNTDRIAVFTDGTGTRTQEILRTFWQNGGNLTGVDFTTSLNSDIAIVSTTLSTQAFNNTTTQYYLYVSAQLTNSADSVYLANYEITN